MAPVTSVSSPQPQTLEGDGPGEDSNSSEADTPSQDPCVREGVELTEGSLLPLKQFSRMQVLSCMVQIETKTFIECTNKGCLYISLTIWDMVYHLPKCEGAKGSDKLKKCRYCPHGTKNVDGLNNHIILSHSYAPEVLDKHNRLEFKDLRQEEREAFLTSANVRKIIRSHWRICYQTKGFIICMTQTCRFVTSLIPVMEDHYIGCSPQIWKDLKFTCERCLGKTLSKETLDAHIEECHRSQNLTFNTVQPEAKRFWELSLMLYGASKCVSLHCKFIASNMLEMERHYRYCRVPHVENYEVCDYCGGWCDSVDDKLQHIAALHSHATRNDESEESLKELEHLEVLKKLINLDLNSSNFPWVKVMSYGGEAVLNRAVEGIEEIRPQVRYVLPKKKTKKVQPNSDDANPPVVPKKVVPKKDKPVVKRIVTSRRKSSRASDIASDVSLHAIRAEELFTPDKTILEDLGQAIELECLETPKEEFQVRVGDQSWSVMAPSLDIASEVITRKMPSYSVKSVLAQSIEDSLNLLKIEAKVSSIENVSTKPYVPPKVLSFANKRNVLESIKKKLDLIRRMDTGDKCADSFMTGDPISETQEIAVKPQEPDESSKKKSKRKEFGPGVRPWQSLARIKQKPVPEPDSDDSTSEVVPDESSIPVLENESAPSKTRCKILLPKRKSPSQSVGQNEIIVKNEEDKTVPRKETTITSRNGKNAKVSGCNLDVKCARRKYGKQDQKSNSLCDQDCTKMVRDVAIQHGPSAFPTFTEPLVNNRYSRATLLIGYPYSMMKPSHVVLNADKYTQAATRNYSGRPQILNQKLPVSSTAPHNQSSEAVAVTSESQKKMVVLGTLAPVDPLNPTGARILKETRLIGNLKQTVMQNLSRVGHNGAPGMPCVVRFIRGPVPKSSLSPGSNPVTSSFPVQTLIPCSAPAMIKNASQIITMSPTGMYCRSVTALSTKPLVSSSHGHKADSVSISAGTTDVKMESLDAAPLEDPNRMPAISSGASTVSTISTSSAPSGSVVSSVGVNSRVGLGLSTSLSASGIPSPPLCVPSPVTPGTSSGAVPNLSGPPSTSCLENYVAATSISPLSNISGVNTVAAVSGGFSNVLPPSASSNSNTANVPSTSTPSLKTYSRSSKLRSMLQVAKRRRLDIPSPLEGCSKEISLPQQDRISLIPYSVPVPSNKSALLSDVDRISDYFYERAPEESRLDGFRSHSKTYLKQGSVGRPRPFEDLDPLDPTYSCCCRAPSVDPENEYQYGIFYDKISCDKSECSAATIRDGTKPGCSTGCGNQRREQFDASDLICCDSLENVNSFDPSIPFEVLFDRSTAAQGGLYNDKFPWEGKISAQPPSVKKPVLGDIPSSSSLQTTLHMEIEEGPVRAPKLEKEPAESGLCSGSFEEGMIENCSVEPSPNAENERNSGPVNDLPSYLTSHNGLQVQSEPMVYTLNKILLDQPNILGRQRNPIFESLIDNDERRRLMELVHYLTHYNRLQITNNPTVCIASKTASSAPSTSRNSGKEPEDSGKGRKSLHSKKMESGKSQNAVDSGVPEKSAKKGRGGIVPKKPPRKSAVDTAENQGEVERPERTKGSTAAESQEPCGNMAVKKRGRKPKFKEEDSLSSTKLEDAIDREGGSKAPPRKQGRKSKKSVAAENESVVVGSRLHLDTKKGDEGLTIDVEHSRAQVVKPASEVQEPGGSMAVKKRGRKPKVKKESLTSAEDVSTAHLNTELDYGGENGQESGKTLPPKKPGRKPKKSVAAGHENFVESRVHESTRKNDEELKMDVEDSEVEVEKASGKKTRNSSVKPADVLLEMEVEPGDDEIPQTSAGRRLSRGPPKKYVDPPETEESIFGEVLRSPKKKPKKMGRPRKDLDDWLPDPPQDGGTGNIFLYHDDEESDEGLVPAYDRIIFNSTLPNPKKLVTCAICNATMPAKVYKTHHVFKHNHICWLKNEEPMDLDDELTLERHLYKVYCHLRKPFHCEVCGKAVKSARGFISHKKFCGKSSEERRETLVRCAVCSRLLKPSSIQYHIQNHHSQNVQPPPVKEELVELPARAAASRCLQKMSATAGVNIDEDEERREADSQPWIKRYYNVEKRRITNVIKTLFSAQISKDGTGVARCLNAGCGRSDRDVKTVIEHYKTCDAIPLDFKCKVCAYIDSNECIMIHHVRTLHLDKSLDYKEKKALLSAGAGEMPEFSGKFLPYLKAAEASSRSLLYLESALLWTNKIRNDLVAPGCVFPEFSSDEDAIKSFEDYPPSHFELRDKSMRIAFNDKPPEWISLTKLTSCRASNNNMVMYTGGVIRSLDWFPSEGEQYLIVAIGSIGPETINVRSTKSGPGHLQIWSAGQLNNFVEPPEMPLKFEFAFCHDFGEVWDLQCCPGGEPDEKRLGLVALATSSGKIVVCAVPSVHSSSELGGSHRAVKPEPMLILETGLHASFQVSKVAWSKVKPHRFIAGGFTNGMVAVWDLTTTSILLRCGNTMMPFKMFNPHFTTITGLSFSPVHEYYIVTACADKSSKFFNLEDTSISHVEFNRGLFMDVAWLHHWMSAVAVIDDNTTLGTTTAMIHPLRNFIYQAHPSVTQAESCCLSVSVNDWLNAFVCSYDSGQVLLTFARKHCHMLDDRKRGHAQLITPEFHNFNPTPKKMIDCQSYAATSENFGIIFNSDFSVSPTNKLKPVPLTDVTYFPSTAANKVCWNPNVNSFLTVAVGYHSGFVILGRIKLSSFELADLASAMSGIRSSGQPAPSGSGDA